MSGHRALWIMATFDVVVFAGIGLWTLVDPVGALSAVEVGAATPAAVIELRAMYGGLELAIAALFVGWMWDGRAADVVIASAVMLGGLGVVRGAGMLSAGIGAPHHWLIASEVVGVVTNVMALLWARRTAAARARA